MNPDPQFFSVIFSSFYTRKNEDQAIPNIDSIQYSNVCLSLHENCAGKLTLEEMIN